MYLDDRLRLPYKKLLRFCLCPFTESEFKLRCEAQVALNRKLEEQTEWYVSEVEKTKEKINQGKLISILLGLYERTWFKVNNMLWKEICARPCWEIVKRNCWYAIKRGCVERMLKETNETVRAIDTSYYPRLMHGRMTEHVLKGLRDMEGHINVYNSVWTLFYASRLSWSGLLVGPSLFVVQVSDL